MTALGVIGFQIMATHQVAHAVDRAFPHDTVVWLFACGAGCMLAEIFSAAGSRIVSAADGYSCSARWWRSSGSGVLP